MFPGVNPRQMQQMMKKMGVSQEDLDASEVIIKLPDRKLVFENPQVAKVDMMGQATYQIVGSLSEQPLDDEEIEISEEDINTVMEQTGADKKSVHDAIKESNGDLADAILKLQ
jgi:nascent polypeptide-associated complex subunit alpha